MKVWLSVLCLSLGSSLVQGEAGPVDSNPPAATAATSEAPASPRTEYEQFIQDLVRPQSVADLVQVMARSVDEAEVAGEQGAPMHALGTTRGGLHFELQIVHAPEAILYHCTLNRGGKELNYADVARVMAFFADRAGLTHPVDIREGERPVFSSQWLIKPKEWKQVRKKMLEVRKANRAEKDLMKGFATAIRREMDARANFQRERR